MMLTRRPRRHLQLLDVRARTRSASEELATNTDAHALEVSATVRLLQEHLHRLRLGHATEYEQRIIKSVVRAAAVARECLRQGA